MNALICFPFANVLNKKKTERILKNKNRYYNNKLCSSRLICKAVTKAALSMPSCVLKANVSLWNGFIPWIILLMGWQKIINLWDLNVRRLKHPPLLRAHEFFKGSKMQERFFMDARRFKKNQCFLSTNNLHLWVDYTDNRLFFLLWQHLTALYVFREMSVWW